MPEQVKEYPVVWFQGAGCTGCSVSFLNALYPSAAHVLLEQVVPGSHRWGLLDESDFFSQDLDAMKKKIEEATGREFKTVPCELKAGEVSFHHSLSIHGSGPNFTDQPRRSVVLHLQPAHAYYIPGTDCDEHQCPIMLKRSGGHAGDLFRGEYWPVLYSKGK